MSMQVIANLRIRSSGSQFFFNLHFISNILLCVEVPLLRAVFTVGKPAIFILNVAGYVSHNK